jgi:two-component system, NarL family, sensor histidine kinase UhpB
MSKKSFSDLSPSRSPDKLQRFIANLPGMACQIRLDTDSTLHFPYVSEGCFALLGMTASKIKQQPHLMLDMLHPKDRHAFHKSMQVSAARSTPWNWEGRIVLPLEGEIKWVNLRASQVFSNSEMSLNEGF